MTKQKIHTVRVNAKCSDLCWVALCDETGAVVVEGDGYVPDFMPGEHCGDYVELEIDPMTGVIVNWDKTYPEKMMIKDVEDM